MSEKLTLFPVPTKDELSLQYMSASNETVVVAIYNSIGAKQYVQNWKVEAQINSLKLTLDGFSSGIYYLVLHTGERVIAKQFIVD